MFAGLLSGCEFTFLPGNAIKINGYVTFENKALEGVKIKSDFFVYTTTDAEGYYEFETHSKTLTFFAKKAGYAFSPKIYTPNKEQVNYNFEAEKATHLNGVLTLTKVLVSPTSIVSIPRNNYDYKEGVTSQLKLAEFIFSVNSDYAHTVTPNKQSMFLPKGVFSNILTEQSNFSFPVNTQENERIDLSFSFMLKAWYKADAYTEEISTERMSSFKTNSILDTGDLDENNQIKFSVSSINSYEGLFTYNLQFVFEYQEKQGDDL